jgi:hypothetical protein
MNQDRFKLTRTISLTNEEREKHDCCLQSDEKLLLPCQESILATISGGNNVVGDFRFYVKKALKVL